MTEQPSFLRRLGDKYRHVRDGHVRRLLGAAHDLDGADISSRYVDAALQFGAREMQQALFQLMTAPNDPLPDRAKAAQLYLRGAEQGWWNVSPQNADRACALVAANTGEVKPPQPKAKAGPRKSTRHPDEIQQCIAISGACLVLEGVIKDPKADNAARLEAIDKWLRAMGWLAPEQLGAALDRAKAKTP